MNNDNNATSSPSTPPPVPSSIPSAPSAGIGDDAGVRMLIPVGRDPLAIIAGYLGIFSLIIIPAPISLIVSMFSIMRLKKSRKTNKPLRGMGRAIFGLVMGLLGTGALAFGLISHFSS